MPTAPSPRLAGFFRRRREELAGALVLVLLLVVLLREPIFAYASVTFTTADLTQNYSLTNLERGNTSNNVLVSDPVTQFVPWLLFNGSELAHGRVPLWNPYNGCGAPHLANYQSAVFSPFSVPFYVFGLKFALLASAFFKLFLAGFGTFLFLRRIELAWLPALFGGACFMFSGHNVLLASYPHGGVIALMPFALLCAERLLRSFEAERRGAARRPRTWTWIAFTLLLTASVYAGHPETLCFSVATVALWIVVRLVAWWWRARRTAAAALPAAGFGARFLVAGSLSAGLGAPQILPFFEYLEHSAKLISRERGGHLPLDVATWPRYFFPDLFGSPGARDAFAASLPSPNYEAATLGYVGALVLLLALFALPRAVRDVRFAPFALLAIAWVFWAHDLFGASSSLDTVPLLRHLPIPVSQGPWAFALAACAAFQIQVWLDAPLKRAWLASAAISATTLVALYCFYDAAVESVRSAIAEQEPDGAAIAASKDHLHFIAGSVLLGLVGLAGIRLVARRHARVACASVVLGAICAQTGWVLSEHNTSCLDRYVYPLSPQIERVRNAVTTDRALIVGKEGVPPCSNMVYGLDLASLYDGLSIRTYDDLYVQRFHAEGNWRQAHWASENSLRLFGIEWLLMRNNPPDIDPATTPSAAYFDGERTAFTSLGRVGQHELQQYTRSLGRYWLVGKAKKVASAEQALALATASEFDPEHELVLGPDVPEDWQIRRRERAAERAEPTVERRVTVLERLPTRVKLRVEHDQANYLVLTVPWFPGWRATIDGQPARLARANYAFTALDVPAQTHDVELVYEPESWANGLRIAAVAAAVAAVLALLGFAHARKARASLS